MLLLCIWVILLKQERQMMYLEDLHILIQKLYLNLFQFLEEEKIKKSIL